MRKYMMAAIALLIAVPAWGADTPIDVNVQVTVEKYCDMSIADQLLELLIEDNAVAETDDTEVAVWTNSAATVTVADSADGIFADAAFTVSYGLDALGDHAWAVGVIGNPGDTVALMIEVAADYDAEPGNYLGTLTVSIAND